MNGSTADAVDVIYIAACSRDARLTRICVASIRYFYPNMPIEILSGDIPQPGFVEELMKYWNVGVAKLPVGDYGWGFVKLEPLFGPPGKRFMVVDSDTVFVGPVLDTWADGIGDFLVDDEKQIEADTHRLYYDWQQVAAIDPSARPPQFVFNSGQWFGTTGILTRAEFAHFVDWDEMPPKLRYAELFMPGDQGVMNYVVNQQVQLAGLKVERQKIMRWPGHGMDDLSPAAVQAGTAPARVIHWAGMKATLLQDMVGGELLQFFEDHYFTRLPMPRLQQRLALWRHVWIHWSLVTSQTLLLLLRKWRRRIGNDERPTELVKEAIGK